MQQRLFEFRMGERAPETLVVASANADAARLLADWRNWPGRALALVGPAGSGKTHLALAWALEAGARQLPARAGPAEVSEALEAGAGAVLVENLDRGFEEAMLWRLLDAVRANVGSALLTGQTPPSAWRVTIPDLRSRLAALPVARLGEPDEALMGVVLRRFCREQFILLSDDAVEFLVRRLPRTFAAARALADALDATLVKGAKPVSVAIAKRALEKAQAAWGSDPEGA